jgi:protein involved in polysaccharide export with SLBB domain
MKWWLLSLSLGACASATVGAALLFGEPPDYCFAPGDVIEVTVTPQHELGRIIRVRPDGNICCPVVGHLHVAGLTADQLADELHNGLKRSRTGVRVMVMLGRMDGDTYRPRWHGPGAHRGSRPSRSSHRKADVQLGG